MSGGAMRGRGSRRLAVFGGLRGEMSYADNSFDDLDLDIQRMFYDDDDHQGDARQAVGSGQLASRLAEQGLVLLSITAEHAKSVREFPELIRHDKLGCNSSPDRVLLGLDRDFILNATK